MWRNEKTNEGSDLIWDGVEKGIAVSPTKGTANLQNVNISTETGEAMMSFARMQESQNTLTSQSLTPSGSTLFNAPATLQAGQWVKVTASTVTGITATTGATTLSTNYLVVGGGGAGGSGYATASGAASGGGGGAGQYVVGTTNLSVGKQTITIGAGGIPAYAGSLFASGNGTNTIFGSVATAVGGGGGGLGIDNVGPITPMNGVNGASGGGGGGGSVGFAGTGGTASAGNSGGAGFASATNNQRTGGGGGGASSTGTAGASGVGGSGGSGTASSITGVSVTYAAGGGGGNFGTGGSGGSSGAGGAGGTNGDGSVGTAFGSGGGGASVVVSGTSKVGGAGVSGVVIISYATGSAFCTGGTISYTATNTVHTFTSNDVFEVVSINPGGYYFVSYKDTNNRVKLSTTYDPYGLSPITTHGTTGTVTFSTVTSVGSPIAKAIERYGTTTDVAYRYYILDSAGYVWVYDTAVYASTLSGSGVGTKWMLPDPTTNPTYPYTGMGVLNGWLFCLNNRQIYLKPTVNLGQTFATMTSGQLTNPFPIHSNFVLTGHQGKLHYCDGNYIGEIFPTTSFITSLANIQSYGTYTASSTTGTITALLGGSTPWTLDANGATARIPAVFFTSPGGTLPTALSQNTVYYIEYNVITYTFSVYAAITGGSALNVATGATGTQYYNTFYPIGTDAGSNGTHPTVQFTQQRVDLPFTEEAQCLVEIGNTILIGCASNIVYPWNQVDATPSDLISLPEKNVAAMINVNNMVYIFAGNKGNIYITNGSVASLILSVPDYCAGIPGTPSTYIEPYFTWGDAMYLRGRVYFSILDQTATKAGNCGGVWSFVPTQNLYQGQDIGQALRLENQNSYGTYNGMATVLIPSEVQTAIAPQYWAGWQSSYTIGTSTFGIDFTSTNPVTLAVIETDLLATGTFLSKRSFAQLEYKMTTPTKTGDLVKFYVRLNGTDAWTYLGAPVDEHAVNLSGYTPVTFQKTQWIQLRIELTSDGTTNSSFNRLKQIMIR